MNENPNCISISGFVKKYNKKVGEKKKFSEIPYKRPDFDKLISDVSTVINEFKAAKSADEQYTLLKKFEDTTENYSTQYSVAHIRNTVNTKDEFYKAEMEFFVKKTALLQEKSVELNKALVNSEYKKDLIKLIGEVPFLNAELDIKSFSPEIISLKQEEDDLKLKYQGIYAGLTAKFDGKTLPIPMLGPYKQSVDREVRKAAFVAEGKAFDSVKPEFDEIFEKLVKNRTEQAKMLGYDNFVELGYMRRQRNCYSKKEVAVFKKQVIDEIVPLVKQIREIQKKRIELDKLYAYDLPLTFKDGAATPQVSSEEIMAAGKKMYTEMSPQTAEFIKLMYDNELFDVLSKDGKAPGGYCTSIPAYKYPFIFSNFNGTSGDVDVLTHEAGHAFAGYQCSKLYELDLMREYSMEIAETHSMAMEFLTSPWHNLFFKEQTAKYQLSHAEGALIFIPYGCQVDEFQEIIYSNPDLTADERHEKWIEIENKFRPDVEHGDIPFYSRGAGWQRQLHIYMYPFYYIDYCMAQTMALQFFAEFIKDSENALKMYIDFVNLGGSKTFVDIIKTTGFKSPLDDGAIKDIVDTLKQWLDENQI